MVSVILVSGGLLCWPSPIRRRLGRPGPDRSSASGQRPWFTAASPVIVVVVTGAVLVMSAAAGPLVALSAAVVLVTVAILVRSELARARERRDLGEMLSATRSLTRELRSGAAPLAAISACAAAHRGTAAAVLEALAVDIAGDRGSGAAVSTDAGLTVEITGRLVRGWSLSARYGVPWASLVETVSVDLADRMRAKAQRSAQVSGPRVSGYVLAVMPCLGVLLGVGMGADPLHVLLGTGAGQLMLLVGCLLTCIGLAWTARIVRG